MNDKSISETANTLAKAKMRIHEYLRVDEQRGAKEYVETNKSRDNKLKKYVGKRRSPTRQLLKIQFLTPPDKFNDNFASNFNRPKFNT